MKNTPRDESVPKEEIDPQLFIEAKEQTKARYGRFNLAVIGGTGVGKSSLVNAVFGRDVAAVGKGLPVTRGVHYYSDDILGIWDVEGFEIGSPSPPADRLRENLKLIASRPALEQVSVVWYCVLASSDRLTEPDIAMIRELDEAGLPVVLVLTKVDWRRNPVTGGYKPAPDVADFLEWLREPIDSAGAPIELPVARVIPTSTRDSQGKGTGHGLGELVAETLSLSPEDEKDAFRVAQRLNLPWKRQMAQPVVAGAATAAAAAAAVPFPVSDAVTLAPIQMTMMGRVAAIYDLDLKTMLSASALAQLICG